MENQSRHPGEGAAAGNDQSGNDVTSLLRADRQEIRAWLALQSPNIHVWLCKPDGPNEGQYFGDDVEGAASYVASRNESGLNCYFTPNTPTVDCGRKPTKQQIAAIRVVHVDVDPPKDGATFDKDAALATLKADRPTFIIDSGGGLQAYWALGEPIEATDETRGNVEAVNKAVIAKQGGDAAASNVDRVMRIPGTINWPNAKKRAAGRVPAMARVIYADAGDRPSLAQLEAHFRPVPAPAAPTPLDRAPIPPVGDRDVVAVLCRDLMLAALYGGDLTAYGGDASAGDMALVNALVPRTNFDREQVERIWSNSPLGQRNKTQDREPYRRMTIDKAFSDNRGGLNKIAEAWIHAELERKRQAIGNMPSSRFKLLSGEDLRNLPRPEWRIKGVLPAQGLAVIYGPSTAGKSFFALDMGCKIAEGGEWFGHRAKQAHVVYLALEGKAGFPLRIAAWESHNDRELPDAMRVILDSFNLRDAIDVAELAKVCPQGSVLMIDTMARAGDDDENDSKQRRELINRASQLQELIEGVVVLIAHTGKDEDKGIRGHKSLFDSLDASILVKRDGIERSWSADKVKEADEPKGKGFRLQRIELGEDEDGELVTSCVIERFVPSTESADDKPMSGNTKIAFAAFQSVAGIKGELNADGGFAGLHEDHWREQFYADHGGNEAAKRQAFNRARKDLHDRGEVIEQANLWRIAGDNAATTNALIAARLAGVAA